MRTKEAILDYAKGILKLRGLYFEGISGVHPDTEKELDEIIYLGAAGGVSDANVKHVAYAICSDLGAGTWVEDYAANNFDRRYVIGLVVSYIDSVLSADEEEESEESDEGHGHPW